jgi:hypothetical protein
LGFLSISDPQKDAAQAAVFDLERHLVRCVEVRDRIAADVAAGWKDIKARGVLQQQNAYTLPGVADLQSRCESFLHSARLGLFQCGKVVAEALKDSFKERRPDYGHRFDLLAKWSATNLGEEHEFTWLVRNCEPWVARIVRMRNAVDHPKDGPGNALHVLNFALHAGPNGLQVFPPGWHLTGEEPADLLNQMSSIIDGVIEVQEDLLAGLFGMLRCAPNLVLYEKPEAERDPACPKRLFVTLDGHEPA